MTIDWTRYQTDKSYRSEVLQQLAKEQNRKSTIAKNNPEIQTKQTQLEEADKTETEKRTADEHVAENYGNKAWSKVGGLMVGTGLGTSAGIYALPWINAALTPSTYLDAIGVPSWVGTSANLGTSAYFAQDNAKKFKKNPTLENGIYTTLSFIPATRVDYSKLGKVGEALNTRMLATSVRDDSNATKFVNKAIEHLSNKGITEGAGLKAASESDVGFHFSPVGSSTTLALQKATNAPFIRQGWWTLTKNTAPFIAEDKGVWTRMFNPEFYKGLGKWEFPTLSETTQDALHASRRGTNYVYTNAYEAPGHISYMSTEPYMSVVLSSNTKAPQQRKIVADTPKFVQKLLKRSLF